MISISWITQSWRGPSQLRYRKFLTPRYYLWSQDYTSLELPYSITHFGFGFCGFPTGLGFSTALQLSACTWSRTPLSWTYRIASSNTLLRFLCVSAEHSRYLCALISLDTWSACSYDTGSILFCRSDSIVPRSSLKSSFVPTRMIGTFGAWCSISGNHFAFTLSKEGGLTMEKQIKNTSVCG